MATLKPRDGGRLRLTKKALRSLCTPHIKLYRPVYENHRAVTGPCGPMVDAASAAGVVFRSCPHGPALARTDSLRPARSSSGPHVPAPARTFQLRPARSSSGRTVQLRPARSSSGPHGPFFTKKLPKKV
uniref:Uncharacterized protein n=1 Tax=Branchiostoma floridae TaxID=7739 RepID=C3YDQ0_BRAFL|eukprot:XP_002605509.1 hypothetical protein BRAFLDRAFT_92932 [Branchiostoma floridae]